MEATVAETKIEWTAYRAPDGRMVKGFTFNGDGR